MATAFFDLERVRSFRPHWIDLPILIWCLCPLASSISNNLGIYDGVAAVFQQTVTWGVPYAIGRLYFSDLEGLRELAIGLLIGGLIYAPLCLFEITLGPQLHKMMYGYYQHSLRQTMRFGGWRPMVFMQHGLMVGVWMMAASLSGLWLWRTGALTRLARVPMVWWAAFLLATTILVKSVNAWVLLGIGSTLLWCFQRQRSWLPMLGVLMLVPGYVGLRATGLWSGEGLPTLVSTVINDERARSVAYRLRNENLMVGKARQHPLVGWGRWGRARAYDAELQKQTVPDSLWILGFGQHGFVGLISLVVTLLLPVLMFWHRYPIRQWGHRRLAPAAVLGLILVLYAIDNCFNAMVNPIYMLAGGGLAGLTKPSNDFQPCPEGLHNT